MAQAKLDDIIVYESAANIIAPKSICSFKIDGLDKSDHKKKGAISTLFF
jgi:hypothetical protein